MGGGLRDGGGEGKQGKRYFEEVGVAGLGKVDVGVGGVFGLRLDVSGAILGGEGVVYHGEGFA